LVPETIGTLTAFARFDCSVEFSTFWIEPPDD
jgi:hypothetical protein